MSEAVLRACSLLAVGFGDAGAEVIANNIKSGGDLNPMIPGNKVVAIFGFCDIRNFTDTTEVLQEDIMEFVNSIADIVHTEVRLAGHVVVLSGLGTACYIDGGLMPAEQGLATWHQSQHQVCLHKSNTLRPAGASSIKAPAIDLETIAKSGAGHLPHRLSPVKLRMLPAVTAILAPIDILLLWLQVALHGGSPNKNIGDAFLLVWKFPKGFTQTELARMLSATDTDLVGSNQGAHSTPSVHTAWPSIPGSGVRPIALSLLASTGLGFIRTA